MPLGPLFNYEVSNPRCHGFEYFTALEAGGAPMAVAGLLLQSFSLKVDQFMAHKRFFVAMRDTNSFKTAYKEFRVNTLPSFAEELQVHHLVNVTRNKDNKLLEPANYVYESPLLVDADGHSLSLDIIGLKSSDQLTITISSDQSKFVLEVNGEKVSESVVFNATVVFGDEHHPMHEFLGISIQIEFSNLTVVKQIEVTKPIVKPTVFGATTPPEIVLKWLQE